MKRLVLVGAGHTHLILLERVVELRAAGLDPLLIAPRFFDYSGLATAVLNGSLSPTANRIDVAALASGRSVRFIEDKIVGIDASDREVRLASGSKEPYDLLSLNLGSQIDHTIAGEGDIRLAKPLSGLVKLRDDLALRATRGQTTAVVIAGAGATGTEIAASIEGLGDRSGHARIITLVGKHQSGRAWARLYRHLENRGVILVPHTRVLRRTPDQVLLGNGDALPCDILVNATGLAPHPLGVEVASTLQSREDPVIYAAGDCATFRSNPLPKHGVFGVRQAPTLAHNLIAAARGEPLVPYRPQQRWLSILDLGNGEGFATWGGLSNRSKAALRLKRHLDLRFVRRFR